MVPTQNWGGAPGVGSGRWDFAEGGLPKQRPRQEGWKAGFLRGPQHRRARPDAGPGKHQERRVGWPDAGDIGDLYGGQREKSSYIRRYIASG